MANKQLIEVALPLEKINAESAREKSIRHGHPSTLHLWWARRPLAAARAVIWSSLVDDPSSHPELFPTEEDQAKERERLFKILEDLVVWENSNDQRILDAAKAEILKSTNGMPPALLDPFAGGGAIPLEAQRLGLEAHAHDLNPVAVMINKAMIEIPPKFAGQAPVNPDVQSQVGAGQTGWQGAGGLAEDVRYYGEWMKQEAYKRIGHLYPKVKVPQEQGGGEATENRYIIVFDNSFDNVQLYMEQRALERAAASRKNVFLLHLICFEYTLLEFDQLIDWIYAPDDEFREKRSAVVAAREKLVEMLHSGDMDYKTIREVVEYDQNLSGHNIEQLSARLLFDLTRNTGWEVSKGKIGDCWIKSCCDWEERQEDDICGLDTTRLTIAEKMRDIYRGTSLQGEFAKIGWEVSL